MKLHRFFSFFFTLFVIKTISYFYNKEDIKNAHVMEKCTKILFYSIFHATHLVKLTKTLRNQDTLCPGG